MKSKSRIPRNFVAALDAAHLALRKLDTMKMPADVRRELDHAKAAQYRALIAMDRRARPDVYANHGA